MIEDIINVCSCESLLKEEIKRNNEAKLSHGIHCKKILLYSSGVSFYKKLVREKEFYRNLPMRCYNREDYKY